MGRVVFRKTVVLAVALILSVSSTGIVSVLWPSMPWSGAVAAAPRPQSGAFELHFDSRIDITSSGSVSSHHVRARVIMSPKPGQSTRFAALGTLQYEELNWAFDPGGCSLLLDTQDSSLHVREAIIPAGQGDITLTYLPTPPTEVVTVVCSQGSASTEAIMWYTGFASLHEAEWGAKGLTVTDWSFPGGDVYARKTYQRTETVQAVTFTESTTIELIGRPLAPTIEEIFERGKGHVSQDPETGSPVELWATIENPDPAAYAIDRCSWAGDLPAPGEGDPNDNCRFQYTPATGHGPNRQTYGPKDVQLTITYRHRDSGATGQDESSHSYDVFFPKRKDDLGNGNPNWFDYWGDDGAVPGLDAPDIAFDGTKSSYGSWNSRTSKITLGPKAAEVHYPRRLEVPSGEFCPGGSFGGAQGIDSVAEVLSHEREHERIYENWHGGPWVIGITVDSDDPTPETKRDHSDKLPDLVEVAFGTNPLDPDSCNLAAIKSPRYSTYGDNEFRAMLAGDGRTGNPSNDWANPGKQTNPPFQAQQLVPESSSGPVSSTFMYVPGEEFPDAAQISGPISSRLSGETPDGRFQSLVVDVNVDVLLSDEFSLVGWLQDSQGVDLVWASYDASLEPGTHTLSLSFDGRVLNDHGADGPYTLAVLELRLGDHGDTADTVLNAHTTAAYSSTQFAPYAATLSQLYNEATTDADGDGLYDQLQLGVAVEVNETGSYRVVGQLTKGDMILTESRQVTLETGSREVILSYDGAALFQYGENGPYRLDPVWVENEAGERLDTDRSYETLDYQIGSFEHGSVLIDRSSYSEQPVDDDGNGRYETLEIGFQITSDRNEIVRIRASLEDAGGAKIAASEALASLTGSPLTPGLTDVTLQFEGSQISANNVNGPYRLVSVTAISAAGEVLDVHPFAFTTNAYIVDEFETAPVFSTTLPLILTGV